MSIARGAAAAVAPGSGPRAGAKARGAGGGTHWSLLRLTNDHLSPFGPVISRSTTSPGRITGVVRGVGFGGGGAPGRPPSSRASSVDMTRRARGTGETRRGRTSVEAKRGAPDVRVARAGGVRRRGHPRGGWGARSREVERREVRPTAILCQGNCFPYFKFSGLSLLAPPRERFKRATRRARARGLARRGASPHSARHARGRPEPRAVLDAHRRGRSRLRRDTPPRRRRPRRAPPPSKPPRVLREEARLRAEAEALLARMSSEATRAKTLAAATATAAASTRTIPAPKNSSARGDLPAPRRRGDAPRPDPPRHPQRPDARRRSLREPRAAHPEPPPRAPRDPSLERVAREAVERARHRLADAQTARVETDEARRRRDDAVAAAAAARTRRVAADAAADAARRVAQTAAETVARVRSERAPKNIPPPRSNPRTNRPPRRARQPRRPPVQYSRARRLSTSPRNRT